MAENINIQKQSIAWPAVTLVLGTPVKLILRRRE